MSNAYRADIDLLTSADSGLRDTTLGVCIHTQEGDSTADNLARYCQNTANGASYNLIIDKTGRTARSNDDPYAPWAAMHTANKRLFHVCLTGYAKWDRATWLSRPRQLERLADVLRVYAFRYAFPLDKIGAADLRSARRGVCGHVDASAAWKESDHWDPGPGFPYDHVLGLARGTAGKDDAMTPEQDRMLREVHDALTRPRPSLIDDSKAFDAPTYLQLIDAATYRIENGDQ